MPSSYTGFLRLEKPDDDDITWGDAHRDALDAIDYALHGAAIYHVDPQNTTGNLYPGVGSPDSARRDFAQIQDAIDAAEAVGYANGYVIEVAPGDYLENLTITASVAIIGKGGSGPTYYGPAATEISGLHTAASPLITIAPADGEYVHVVLRNISLENSYDQANAVEITDPYLIDGQDQTSYSATRSKVVLDRCSVRMQTWGEDNVWTSALRLIGNYHLVLERCRVSALNYGGGNNNGMIRRMVHIEGNNTANVTCIAHCMSTIFSQSSYDDGGELVVWYFDNKTQLTAYDCAINLASGDSYTKGGTGTNTSYGVEADASTYKNAYALGYLVVS